MHTPLEGGFVHYIEGVSDLIGYLEVGRPGQAGRVVPDQFPFIFGRNRDAKFLKAYFVHVKDIEMLSQLLQVALFEDDNRKPSLSQSPGKIAPTGARTHHNDVSLELLCHGIAPYLEHTTFQAFDQAGETPLSAPVGTCSSAHSTKVHTASTTPLAKKGARTPMAS
jgi:hypothetical protein